MKRIFLINTKPKEEPSFSKSFVRRSTELGITCSVETANAFSIYSDKDSEKLEIWLSGEILDLDHEDFFFIRTWRDQKTITALLSYALESRGVPFLDQVIHTSHDVRNSKLSHFIQLKNVGVQFPNTWVGTSRALQENSTRIRSTFSLPIVLKTRGGLGKNVWLIDSYDALAAKVSALASADSNQVFLIQEYIQNSYDIRIIVFYEEVVACIKRSSADGFYNNAARGATTELTEISEAERNLAILASKTVGLDLCGVDLVRSEHGPLLFELNKAADINCFNEAAGFDITTELVTRLSDRTR